MDAEIRRFLEAVFAGKLDALYVLLWTLPEKQSHWFRSVDDAIQFAESLPEHDLYVGVGLSSRDYGAIRRCPSDEVAGIVGVWADIDLKSDAHQKPALPATVEDALKILPSQFPPTFIIQTGNGIHAWWLFREPWIFETSDERREAAILVSRWQTLLRLNASTYGWAFDRLADLARVLRIPGTQNGKDPAHPKPVSIHSQTDCRYNPSDLVEFLDDNSVPDAEEQEHTSRAWKEQFADKPLSLNPDATVPDDLLNRHMTADPRFKKTWLRQREDLKDRSQSGYDLALANFGCDVGLSEQQVVDLIIQHRRIHSQRPRTQLDYFQRTIAKAFKRNEVVGSIKSFKAAAFDQSDAPGHTGEGPHRPKPDSATARAILCEQISQVLGVRILRIVKITGKEPIYQMELDSAMVEFPSISKLVEQRSLRLAIASAVDWLIPRFKPKPWEQIAQTLLDSLTVEDGGEETDFVGSAKIHIDNYLSETPFIDSIMDQPIQARRKPSVIDGRIAICSADLQLYVNKTTGENHPVKAFASMLRAIGASGTRVRASRLRDQTRWLLPLSEFAPDDYTEGSGEGDDVKSS
jgi:hypothetical protein